MRNAEWQGAARNYSAFRTPHSALGSRRDRHLRHVGPVAGGDIPVEVAHAVLADFRRAGGEQWTVVHIRADHRRGEERPRAAVDAALDIDPGAPVLLELDLHTLAGRALLDLEAESRD